MHVQAIHESEPVVEGVPAPKGYRLIWLSELRQLRELVSAPIAAELDRAAAARLVTDSQAMSFKFWPAPSEAGQLGRALAAVRA